ncbi:hypothetical protein FNQ90_23085 [Streptomyces alkaliphilus]|uniref:Uncharacterized protein n=1 Tax=Streptomyces alkaliphilus TaxID=1472722 RepID=A0A7W3Y3S3_9ACTN|nr:hypothetical protein [Streptomyces alkaliphilus]MBB0246928.1 hypothetical protein [Streptomyces alkaliphilus]
MNDNEICAPELIDGIPYGCGTCEECHQDEYDAIEADVETGVITDAEALDLHHRNGAL